YRATILLKQQFSYHAVKTLKVKDRPPRSLYKKMRKDMLVAEAYRQMERRKESVKALNKLPKKHKLFPGYEFSLNLAHVSSAKIPEKNTGGQNKMKEAAARTRYVELVVSEFLEIVKGDGFAAGHNSTEFRYWVEGKKIKRNDHAIEVIAKGLKAACEMYGVMHDFLPWVENNPMDRTGYYTQMAELLAWSARILDQLQDGEEEFEKKISGQDNKQKSHSKELSQIKQDTDALTGQLIKITRELVKGMVDSRKGSNPKVPKCPVCSDKKKIRLARLSGEDYQSFVDDITRVLSAKGAKKWFGKSLNQIKQKFTRAVTEKEKTKGEDLHIHRLKLRNELTLYTSTNACSWCMDDEFYKTFFNNHFSQLTPCRLAADDNKGETIDPRRLCALDYDKIMETHENHFRRHLSKPTKHESPPGALNNSKFPIKAAVHFFGLRRWNSISPAEGRSSGGGYLLFRTDEGVIDLGVAIDPGFDFIKNLFHCGFSLVDIDVILLSHSHADHVRDFESMVNLLKELDDRTGTFRRVNVILTLGTYVRLQHVFDNKAFRRHVEPLVIDIEKDINRKYFESLGPGSPTRFSFVRGNDHGNGRREWLISLGNQANDEKLTIWPTRAYHDDYSGTSDSFGFILDIPAEPNHKKTLRFGYTGDTKWVGQSLYPNESSGNRFPGISQQYANCDVLLIHLGSLIDHKNNQRFSDSSKKWRERCEDIVRGKNHPYLPGLIGLLNEVYNSTQGKAGLILLSEFGEELRGTIRTDLVKRLNRVYESGDRSKPWCYILPVDVGLDVVCQPTAYSGADDEQNDDGRFKFWCAQCRRFHPVENIAYRHYGQDEAIFYLCRTCDKTTSPDVLQDRLRHLYDVGRTLRTDDEESDPWK
ncbi:MAG: hypothetical protein H8D67_20270, partial [Deltaproteobacteria bacterium]|nr:hypothetical protein [Deltaproteobacteria bacterium]